MVRFRCFGICLFLTCLSGWLTASAQDNKLQEERKSLEQMAVVFDNLNAFYVDSVDPKELMDKAIQAMTRELDPYTVFYPTSDTAQLSMLTTGRFAGVGASFQLMDDSVVITGLLPGAPFEKRGFKVGDILLALDNKTVTGMTLEDLYKLLEGEEGSKLKVVFKKPWKNKVFEKTVRRKMVTVPSVSFRTFLDPDIGYIRLEQFTRGSAIEFAKNFEALKKDNPEMKGLVIDLRGNPGGLLKESIQITSFFLPPGDTILKVRGRMPGWTRDFVSAGKSLDTLMSLAILVDGRSASGSEILAGAVQDLDRGIIVGAGTRGKGLVQTTRGLPYGAKLKFTVARYYTPSGRSIQALDFKHKDRYGNPTHVVDSLKREFQTASGRPIWDKGGIMPDIRVEDNSLFSGRVSLLMNHHSIFRYATSYVLKNPQRPPESKFEVPEALFSDFEAFLKKYPVPTEDVNSRLLDRFMANAVSEGYFEKIEPLLDQLKEEVKKQTALPLEDYKKELMPLLKEEILNNYYPFNGRIAAGIADDEAIQKAVEWLRDSDRYKATLGLR